MILFEVRMELRRLLKSRSVQAGVCLLPLMITAVMYARMKSPYVHSYKMADGMKMKIWTENDRAKFSGLPPKQSILVYGLTRWFDEWVGTKWNSDDVFKTCPVKNCVLTKDRAMVDVADAVMYRWDNLGKCRKKSKDGQVWILFEHESPAYPHKSYMSCNDDKVNWTCTYRRDSDFTLVHGQFRRHDTGYNMSQIHQLWRSKSKTAVGFISHCRSRSQRDQFVDKLRSHGMDIDIYGECGNKKCGGQRDTKWQGVWNVTAGRQDHCFDVLDTQYKFYLSLENAICKDYVTEKSLHLVLRHQIVPLIRDGAKRSIFHPPHSYIDTKDFKRIKSLAEHIKFLSGNFDRYLEYFNWRKYYSVETVTGVLQSIMCDMCHRMNHQSQYTRLYSNLKNFYMKSQLKKKGKRICKNRKI
ncbi:alpha-(1,3)-fucosyltransferase C-like [Pecten maximus]|uniref:alpha-(1,3)-fucosyltransferase C-like n=1 Tax=Pecten maximus TaxID=6579 RepID=UPI0014582343|nr:alpha-(1,3)-fucosyltransferase C-like [Pecten maximus]